MADNVAITAGTGTTIATDDVGGAQHQRVKVVWGVDGTINDTSASAPLPVVQTGTHNVVATNAGTFAVQVSNANANGQATMANSAPVVIASNQTAVPVSGTVTTTNTPLTNFGAGEYETVAASQTAQALGATGATGDYISGVLVIPATTSPGLVTLLDNAISIPVFVGGASSVSNLVPFFIPLGMISVSGAWKLTTGANVSCIGIGNFT